MIADQNKSRKESYKQFSDQEIEQVFTLVEEQ
jgi:hypothetical protein